MTLAQFAQQATTNEALVRAVVRQAGGWEAFQENAEDVANHGADGGFHGFIYYRDTVAFTRRNREAIIEALTESADSLGETVAGLVRSFRCLGGEYTEDDIGRALWGRFTDSDETTQIYNALAWFALETVAYDYVNAEVQA